MTGMMKNNVWSTPSITRMWPSEKKVLKIPETNNNDEFMDHGLWGQYSTN